MSRGVENNACVISLNGFETTSRGGFGESGSIRIQWSVRTRRTGSSRFHCRSADRPLELPVYQARLDWLPLPCIALLTLGAHAHSEGYSSCRVCMCDHS